MKSGTFLDDNNNLGLQEIEIDELLTAVTESCSEIQRKGNVEEADRPIVVSMENQTFIGSQESSINVQPNKSVQILSNPQVSDDLKPKKISADPSSVNSGRIEAAGTSNFGEFLAESGNKPMEIPDPEIIDCLLGPSKSSIAGEETEETLVLASQNRKKSQETQTDGSNSEVVSEQRSLRRKNKKLNYRVSESDSDRSLNGKPRKNAGNSWDSLKKFKESTETRRLAGKNNKTWECHKCSKNVRGKSYLILHLQSHDSTKDFACRICGKAFNLQASRYQHELRHTAPKVQCNICGIECKNNFALKCHLWYMHSNQRKVRCQICRKVLSSKDVLREHINIVHGSN
jgi:hypothetical protein